MKRIIYTMALVLVFVGGVFAQKSTAGDFAPFQMSLSAQGIETSKGTFDPEDNIFWSNTFSLNGQDDSQISHLTISMDYVNEKPGQINQIKSGNWTLAVYKQGEYKGMIYGDIITGYINMNQNAEGRTLSRFTNIKIRVLGGTDSFEQAGLEGIDGVFTASSEVDTRMPKVRAFLELGF